MFPSGHQEDSKKLCSKTDFLQVLYVGSSIKNIFNP